MICPQCRGSGKVGWDLVNPPDPEPDPAHDAGGSWFGVFRCPLCRGPIEARVMVDRPGGSRTWRMLFTPCVCTDVNPADWTDEIDRRVHMAGFYWGQRQEALGKGLDLPADFWKEDLMTTILDILP